MEKIIKLVGLFVLIESSKAISNCPMLTTKTIIQRAVEAAGSDAALQMQLIRRIHEDVFGGTWGVLIVKNIELVSTSVHWTIPDHKHEDGSPAFCLTSEGPWQYNAMKYGTLPVRIKNVHIDDLVYQKLSMEKWSPINSQTAQLKKYINDYLLVITHSPYRTTIYSKLYK